LFVPLEKRDTEGLLQRHINIYTAIAEQDPIGAKEAMEVHFGVSGLLEYFRS
jgi:DNA-binding FadR family transcriptional regulator